MDYNTWITLPETERAKVRDLSDLSPQLTGLEGWRVEVMVHGETRRFIVGKSTGWRPCHLEVKTRRSKGGDPAAKLYDSVRKLYYAR